MDEVLYRRVARRLPLDRQLCRRRLVADADSACQFGLHALILTPDSGQTVTRHLHPLISEATSVVASVRSRLLVSR